MSFSESASTVAARVRATGRGFISMRRDELRDAFDIGRFTDGQAEAVRESLAREGILVYPHPFVSGPTLRLYDKQHPLAAVAEAVLSPDSIPETPLRTAAAVFERERAGRDLRSDDAPWLVIFELFLVVAAGREPERWEDTRDDRHPSELARELGLALGLPAGAAERASTLRIAAAVCAYRPRRKTWSTEDLATPGAPPDAARALASALETANERLSSEHDLLVTHAAKLISGWAELPTKHVEVGLLGVRYRREEEGRGSK